MTDEIESVRQRPGAFVADTGVEGLHQLVWDLLAITIDQHLVRGVTEVSIDLRDGGVTIRDDGPGFASPIDELVTRIDHRGAAITTGAHGHALGVVNALAARLEVETSRDRVRWRQVYERGKPTTAVERLGAGTIEGTTIRLQPDPEIFAGATLERERVRVRLQQLAWLHPLLRISFQGTRMTDRGGVAGWLNQTHGPLAGPYATFRQAGGVIVDLALGWRESPTAPAVRSFVNTIEVRGGTHVDGLWDGFAAWSNALELPRSAAALRETLGPGLAAIVHVALRAPTFDGTARDQLTSPEAADAVRRALEDDIPHALTPGQPLRDAVLGRIR